MVTLPSPAAAAVSHYPLPPLTIPRAAVYLPRAGTARKMRGLPALLSLARLSANRDSVSSTRRKPPKKLRWWATPQASGDCPALTLKPRHAAENYTAACDNAAGGDWRRQGKTGHFRRQAKTGIFQTSVEGGEIFDVSEKRVISDVS